MMIPDDDGSWWNQPVAARIGNGDFEHCFIPHCWKQGLMKAVIREDG
jgi:hypothetical protein